MDFSHLSVKILLRTGRCSEIWVYNGFEALFCWAIDRGKFFIDNTQGTSQRHCLLSVVISLKSQHQRKKCIQTDTALTYPSFLHPPFLFPWVSIYSSEVTMLKVLKVQLAMTFCFSWNAACFSFSFWVILSSGLPHIRNTNSYLGTDSARNLTGTPSH